MRVNWTAGKMFDGTVLSKKHKNLGYSSSVSIAINTSFALRTFVQVCLSTLIVDILWKNNNDKKSSPLSTGVAKRSGIIFLRRRFKFAHPHETGQQMLKAAAGPLQKLKTPTWSPVTLHSYTTDNQHHLAKSRRKKCTVVSKQHQKRLVKFAKETNPRLKWFKNT